MSKTAIFSVVFIVAAGLALAGPGAASAQGDGTISTAVIDDGVFVTVKESVTGDVLSLYRIIGDHIVLVDTVVNTSSRSSSDTSFPKRYIIRLDVENR